MDDIATDSAYAFFVKKDIIDFCPPPAAAAAFGGALGFNGCLLAEVEASRFISFVGLFSLEMEALGVIFSTALFTAGVSDSSSVTSSHTISVTKYPSESTKDYTYRRTTVKKLGPQTQKQMHPDPCSNDDLPFPPTLASFSSMEVPQSLPLAAFAYILQ